ncbi:MAG: site-specific integrase [Clostridia bacterium]|nr:site-specific integrase [Clostridia bacterium]
MAEKRKKYGLYDKEGNFLCYRMTKRIRNEKGEYDVITAKSKKSVTDCRKVMEQKIQDYYQQKEEEKHKGIYPDMMFKDFADNWYNLNIKDADCSKANKDNYKGYIYTHIIPYFEKYKLCDITEDDCQRFLNQYVGYSKPFDSKLRMTLRRLLKKAKKQKLIPDNPAEDIVLPQVTVGTRRPITDEERALILETAKTHYAGAMVLTMLYCGLRPIEVRRMKWNWIDFENSILTVGQSKTKAGTGRKIPIPPQLRAKLLEHKLKGQNDEWVFVRYKNHSLPLDENAFYHAWHNFCREMDIANGAKVYRNQIVESTLAPDLEPYLLRHTFCTDCQAAGVPLNVAKELMGHSDISVTSKIYTHMVDEVFEQNRKRLADYATEKETQTA